MLPGIRNPLVSFLNFKIAFRTNRYRRLKALASTFAADCRTGQNPSTEWQRGKRWWKPEWVASRTTYSRQPTLLVELLCGLDVQLLRTLKVEGGSGQSGAALPCALGPREFGGEAWLG